MQEAIVEQDTLKEWDITPSGETYLDELDTEYPNEEQEKELIVLISMMEDGPLTTHRLKSNYTKNWGRPRGFTQVLESLASRGYMEKS